MVCVCGMCVRTGVRMCIHVCGRCAHGHPPKEAKPSSSGWQLPSIFAKLTRNKGSAAWPHHTRPCY